MKTGKGGSFFFPKKLYFVLLALQAHTDKGLEKGNLNLKGEKEKRGVGCVCGKSETQ